MRELAWFLGGLVLGVGLYLANPPRWSEDTVVMTRAEAKKPSQSLVARLAEAGASGRRQAGPSLAGAGAAPVTISFDAK
jgi:hypothetical protein